MLKISYYFFLTLLIFIVWSLAAFVLTARKQHCHLVGMEILPYHLSLPLAREKYVFFSYFGSCSYET